METLKRLDSTLNNDWYIQLQQRISSSEERCNKSDDEINEWLNEIEASLPPVPEEEPTNRRNVTSIHPFGN